MKGAFKGLETYLPNFLTQLWEYSSSDLIEIIEVIQDPGSPYHHGNLVSSILQEAPLHSGSCLHDQYGLTGRRALLDGSFIQRFASGKDD